jgi:hypothetical protein
MISNEKCSKYKVVDLVQIYTFERALMSPRGGSEYVRRPI